MCVHPEATSERESTLVYTKTKYHWLISNQVNFVKRIYEAQTENLLSQRLKGTSIAASCLNRMSIFNYANLTVFAFFSNVRSQWACFRG